jgi:Ca-activated chloride channel family protein
MEQVRTNGEQQELRDEIVDLGTRYGIVTPYTSYLATENNFIVDGSSGSTNSTVISRQRVDNLPKGTTFSSQVTVTGEGAIKASKDAKKKQENVSIDEDNEAMTVQTNVSVKKVGVKTFYLENGVWIDSEFKEESKLAETKLQFASNEYFDLVTKEKELAQFFALGEQVIVVWKGKVYRITK